MLPIGQSKNTVNPWTYYGSIITYNNVMKTDVCWPHNTHNKCSRNGAYLLGTELKSPQTNIGISALAIIFSNPFNSV